MTTSLTLPVVPERGDGVWDYISASRLNLWLKCPLAFKFRYIDGIRTPTTPSLFIGKRTHDALEMFYRHRQLGVQLTAEQLTGRIGSTWDEAAAADGMTFESADDAAAASWGRPAGLRCADPARPASTPPPGAPTGPAGAEW